MLHKFASPELNQLFIDQSVKALVWIIKHSNMITAEIIKSAIIVQPCNRFVSNRLWRGTFSLLRSDLSFSISFAICCDIIRLEPDDIVNVLLYIVCAR